MHNNPIRYVDPTGNNPLVVGALAVLALIAATVFVGFIIWLTSLCFKDGKAFADCAINAVGEILSPAMGLIVDIAGAFKDVIMLWELVLDGSLPVAMFIIVAVTVFVLGLLAGVLTTALVTAGEVTFGLSVILAVVIGSAFAALAGWVVDTNRRAAQQGAYR